MFFLESHSARVLSGCWGGKRTGNSHVSLYLVMHDTDCTAEEREGGGGGGMYMYETVQVAKAGNATALHAHMTVEGIEMTACLT